MFRCITSCLLVLTLSLPVSVVRGQTLSEVIANNTDLATLNAAIKAANLSIADYFETDEVTVFAPNNAAFTNLGTVLSDLLLPEYIAHLNSVLLMHAIGSAALESTDLKDGAQYFAANMDPLNISISSTGNVSIVSPNSTATVITPNINTTEGIVHIVDAVLLPKFVSQSLIDLTSTVDGYSIVLKLLDFTGLKALVTDDLKATVFAPTDEAFGSLPAGALEYYLNNTAAATNLLSGHVTTKIVPTQLMTPGLLSAQSPGGLPFYVTIDNGMYKVNNATIIQPNTLAINGIIHGISTVMNVPGAEYPPKTPASPTAPTGGPPTPVAAPTSSSFTSFSVHGMYVTVMVVFFVATTMMM